MVPLAIKSIGVEAIDTRSVEHSVLELLVSEYPGWTYQGCELIPLVLELLVFQILSCRGCHVVVGVVAAGVGALGPQAMKVLEPWVPEAFSCRRWSN